METTGQNSLFSGDIFAVTPIKPAPKKETAKVAEKPATLLTTAEQDIYNQMNDAQRGQLTAAMKGMDLSDPNFMLEYGKETRQKIADVNRQALTVTRTKDLGEVGKSMSNLMLQLRGISIPEQAHGIFGRSKSYVAQLNAKLAPVEKNVDKSVVIMEAHQSQLVEDNDSLEELYNQNLAYYRSLTVYIIAGKMKLEEERRTTLVQLQQKAIASGDTADAEAFRKYDSRLRDFDTLLGEFESSKLLCQQTAPAIRMAQENNTLLIQKFNFIFTTAVPAWRTQIHLALNMENSRQAAQAADAAIDFTNALIRQNADMLKQGTIDVARLSQREIIESDTLEYANQRLIEGIQEVLQIHAEGAAQRAQSREKKAMLEEDLKNELLQLAARNQNG